MRHLHICIYQVPYVPKIWHVFSFCLWNNKLLLNKNASILMYFGVLEVNAACESLYKISVFIHDANLAPSWQMLAWLKRIVHCFDFLPQLKNFKENNAKL